MTDLTIYFITLMGLIFIFGIAIMVNQKHILERYEDDYHTYLNYLRETQGWVFEHIDQSAKNNVRIIKRLDNISYDLDKVLTKMNIASDRGKNDEEMFDYRGLIEKGLAFEVPEQQKSFNEEDYGIDGLYHAINILEKTIGRVEGYQSDDGILSHKVAINAVKELYKKQGEKKPTDKVEPKFKIGDWVVLTAGELSTTLQIVNVDTNKKLYWFNDNSYLPIVDEECLHLWSIQDAKDGDVLTNGESIVIFKQIIEPKYRQHIEAYVGLDWSCNIQVTSEPWSLGIDKTMPATKEQRDQLFQKMKEAGYEWDADKKKLKKLRHKNNLKL